MIRPVDAPKDEQTVRAGEAIRRARDAKGWTQNRFVDELAKAMHAPAGEERTVGQSAVSRWEAGVHAPEYWRWRAIEEVLDMRLGTLAQLLLGLGRSRPRDQRPP
jgi:transcriptional regulator with XRE-family HTH domain